jgi:signal transduction histidine kinase
VSLEDILRIAEENLWSAIQDTGAVITHDALPVVNANLNRMVQLIQNLLSNSMKYRTDQPPRIHLSAERRTGFWMVSVIDNGTGVDEANRERIFHLFRRSAERRTPGSGVGLAICRAIVQQHGGEIWVEPGRESGSNFCFTLPDIPAQEHNTGTRNDNAGV